ncbi:MAG: alpha/beta hydrolase, partial [Clostridia bacterium]|nr:alpha/beta hydrolase [Clostridia bacterium]
ARRAVRWVRAHAAEFGLDPQKIAVMGSSAGGHLAALTATYAGTLSDEDIDEIDREDSRPNAQILCYPVIVAPDAEGIAHAGSYENLLGGTDPVREAQLDPARLATEQTPPAFIWHTANDNCVNVINSYRYAEALRRHNVDTEMHIFPHGPHGMALAQGEPHVGQWTGLLFNWLAYIGWMK